MFEDTGLYSQMRILVVFQKSCRYYVSYKYTDIPQYDAIAACIRTESKVTSLVKVGWCSRLVCGVNERCHSRVTDVPTVTGAPTM